MRTRSARLGPLALALATAWLGPGCSGGREQPVTRDGVALVPVRFVGGTTGTSNIPVNLGARKGFFAEQGIDLRLLNVPGGVEAVTAAAAGEAEVGSYGSPIVVGASAGVPIRIVGSPPAPGQHFILVARPQYRSLADLKGKKVCAGGPGQGTRQAFNVIAGAHGLRLSDFQNVDIGTTAASFAALQAGNVEAVITTEMSGYKAEQEGFGRVIARAEEYFGRYQHSYLFATQRFIDERPELLRRFLAAYRRSVEYVKANPEEAVQFGVRVLELEEKPLRHALGRELPSWDPSGKVDLLGTNHAIEILKGLGELDRSVTVTAEQLVDQRFAGVL